MRVGRGLFRDETGEQATARAGSGLDESFEVSWLLGSQFFVGVVPGSGGLFGVVCGKETAVRERGIAMVDSCWEFTADSAPSLSWRELAGPACRQRSTSSRRAWRRRASLSSTAVRSSCCRVSAVKSAPAVRSLIDADDPRQRVAALRGHEMDDDYVAARRLAQALAWADVFVLSDLDPDVLDGLSLVALEGPEQARRWSPGAVPVRSSVTPNSRGLSWRQRGCESIRWQPQVNSEQLRHTWDSPTDRIEFASRLPVRPGQVPAQPDDERDQAARGSGAAARHSSRARRGRRSDT